MTRDQAIIKLLRENSEKSNRIKELEEELINAKKNADNRFKKLETRLKNMERAITATDKKTRVLKERASSQEHEISNIKYRLNK